MQLVAAVTGLVAVGILVAAVGGLADPGGLWAAFAACAVASLSCALFSSVQARVSERGLEVSFGPLGWPTRRWAPGDIDAARAETRGPARSAAGATASAASAPPSCCAPGSAW